MLLIILVICEFFEKPSWITSSLNDELPGEARGAEDDEIVLYRHRGRLRLGIRQVYGCKRAKCRGETKCLANWKMPTISLDNRCEKLTVTAHRSKCKVNEVSGEIHL